MNCHEQNLPNINCILKVIKVTTACLKIVILTLSCFPMEKKSKMILGLKYKHLSTTANSITLFSFV